MLQEGNIIYFDPFYFKNGNSAKAKYFIVLKITGDGGILGSLPTRKDSIPENSVIENGCIEKPEFNFNCFVISSNKCVTNCNKKFDFPTHIYGHQIDDYGIKLLEETYPLEGTHYEIWGRMKSQLFGELIDCLKGSRTVKRKYKKIL